MAQSSETRALTAALSGPTFVTRSGGSVMRAATRHVERWAPEATAARHGSLRNLGFVDRLVSPWIDAAQRSASLRMFQQYKKGVGEREGTPVSWVFPRPWYQDELDWMAAARQTGAQTAKGSQMLTTRGTYVTPSAQRAAETVPQVSYEFVAPSLSIARPSVADNVTSERVYSPLVPFAAAQAAHVMSRAVAPLVGDAGAPRMSPGLRAVLTAMLERSARAEIAAAQAPVATRTSTYAPEMVTPPAPRPEADLEARATQVLAETRAQHARVAELQRVTRVTAEREYQARAAADAAERAARASSTADRAQQAAAETSVSHVDAGGEQKRIEQRVAERMAERERSRAVETAAQTAQLDQRRRDAEERIVASQRAQASVRLHESARQAAAADARTAAQQARVAQAQATAAQAQAAQVQAQAQAAAAATAAASAEAPQSRFPAEIAAALAALPPELAGYIGRRPERSVQAISEVSEALRAVELIAHGAARGGSVEPTRGPRLAMPAGLGGLVATVERATPMPRPMTSVAPQAQARRASAMRLPAMGWVQAAGGAPATTGAPAAIQQAAAQTPASIQHVAWADRWLARFAGAKPRALDAMTLASAPPEVRLAALAVAQNAPDAAYVAPMPANDDIAARAHARGMRPMTAAARGGATSPSAAMAASAPSMPAPMPADAPIQRFADDAETPDEVFAAISQAATRSRPDARAAKVAGIAPTPALDPASAPTSAPRDTFADFVAASSPAAPGAGLSAQLASSPFAPALHHLLALPAMPSFDVRSLFGSGLAASYLAGLIAPETHEISSAPETPAWATWGSDRVAATQAALGEAAQPAGRDIRDFDGSLVAPTPEGFIVERVAAPEAEAPAAGGMSQQAAAAAIAPLTTLRSALLSWDVEQKSYAGGATETSVGAPTITHGAPVAQSLVDSMRLPMLGDTFSPTALMMDSPHVTDAAHAAGVAMTAPGMIADRAQSWSVAQERSSSDLSYDFVPPELVLAARVYGLGPAEAAQAARLAIAGPGQLAAMASAVDRTFVMALEAQREQASGGRPSAARLRGAATEGGIAQPGVAAQPGTVSQPGSTPSAIAASAPGTSDFVAPGVEPRQPSSSSFGVERRAPRGAFLWPSATVSALGLKAPAPDGEQAMSVAALELLAAQSVAELGTYASIGDMPGLDGELATGTGTMPRMAGGTGTTPRLAAAPGASEEDVLASATAMVPSSRKSKFEALYLALGQSPTGRDWSPAARAARALALAGRGEDSLSAKERASIAWDVLPAVYAAHSAPEMDVVAGGASESGAPLSTGAASARAAQRRAELREQGFVEMRPGLAPLSARAGEALGSYVTTQPTAPGSSASSAREMNGALSRVPTAAPELVKTGRPAGRHGGGEVEIPAWFEAAARKMFSERGGGSGLAADISLAELTLVQAAPASQIAASSRALPSAMPTPPANQHDERPHDHKEEHRIDVEKVANDVYRHIQSLMDSARARNGEPYL
jgi:hypothetical protein